MLSALARERHPSVASYRRPRLAVLDLMGGLEQNEEWQGWVLDQLRGIVASRQLVSLRALEPRPQRLMPGFIGGQEPAQTPLIQSRTHLLGETRHGPEPR